jgi:hypothetical protein
MSGMGNTLPGLTHRGCRMSRLRRLGKWHRRPACVAGSLSKANHHGGTEDTEKSWGRALFLLSFLGQQVRCDKSGYTRFGLVPDYDLCREHSACSLDLLARTRADNPAAE